MSDTVLHRPSTVGEALELLSNHHDAHPIAGGVSLVAIINAQLFAPAVLVSLRGIAELEGIRGAPGGGIVIGAMTRYRTIAADARLDGSLACVREAARSIASPPVRNMGTIGGSISLADPAADLPPALVAAAATIEIASARTTRQIPARAFFVDWYTTALAPGELVTAVRLPTPETGAACYEKLVRVAGDLCIASVALSVSCSGAARAALGGCGPSPVSSDEADALLSRGLDDPALVQAAGVALARAAQPMDDVRGSADYRRMLIPRMLARAASRVRAKLETAS
jgi:aerobic carbon-monoxide dehydrogenase medium subunit